jgi:hypothetical protein
MLDARFKLTYLDPERHDEYKTWLIMEAEKSVQIEVSPNSFFILNY